MKKIVCLLFTILVCGSVYAQIEVIKWSGIQKYSIANDSIGNADVVFLGNSITENWIKCHPDFFKDNKYTGRGISGHTSYQFLLRFREDVIKLSPKIVVINAGTNDIAENCGTYVEEYTFGNIISMVELAQSNGIKVIMSSVLPASAFKWKASIKDTVIKIKNLNERLKEYATKNNIPYSKEAFKSLLLKIFILSNCFFGCHNPSKRLPLQNYVLWPADRAQS